MMRAIAAAVLALAGITGLGLGTVAYAVRPSGDSEMPKIVGGLLLVSAALWLLREWVVSSRGPDGPPEGPS